MSFTPYIAGPPVGTAYFYGRSKMLSELQHELLTHYVRYNCFFLVGTRRMGKTSLLRYLADASPTNVVPLFINLQRAAETDETDREKLNPSRLQRVLHRTYARQSLQYPALNWSWPESDEYGDFVEQLESLAHAAEAANLIVWLLWDEAELIADLDPGTLVRLRSVIQEYTALRTILTATMGLGILNDRTRNQTTSPFLFGFATRFLPRLNEDEALALIEQRNHPDGLVKVPTETKLKLLQAGGGHPFILQTLCERLFDMRTRSLRSPTQIDLTTGQDLNNVFQQDYDNVSLGERMILRLISQGHKLEENLLNQSGLSREKFHSFLHALLQLGLVIQKNDYYIPYCDLFAQWLRSGLVREHDTRVSDQASLEISEQAQTDNKSLAMLGQTLAHRLNVEELRVVCFDLGVDYDDIPGESKGLKSRGFLSILEKRAKISHLIDWLRANRNDIQLD
jgi:hypothetical protein